MKIVVAGAGYVGLSNAVMLALSHSVTIVDVVDDKVKSINEGYSPFSDTLIQEFFAEKNLDLWATTSSDAYSDADVVIIATPTNYDENSGYFDTRSVESVYRSVRMQNADAVIVIKSTVPVGYTKALAEKHEDHRLLFSPEFLREGRALSDCLSPSRIIVGTPLSKNDEEVSTCANAVLAMFKDPVKTASPAMIVGSTEAEAIKLFSNTYLALRIGYFNEMDTFAESKGLNIKQMIEGVCLDPRIGMHYNNPSFGYGGYCLPKDTKQLLANYNDVPQNLIGAIVHSNETRKEFIAQAILNRVQDFAAQNNNSDDQVTVGMYRLSMKRGSDNCRASASVSIARLLSEKREVLVYEPSGLPKNLSESRCKLIADLDEFKAKSDIIVANRPDNALSDVIEKVFTRDIFYRD